MRGKTATETSQTNESSSVITEEWWKKNFTYNTNAALMLAVADALQVSHSRYEKLKKLNKTQKVECDLIELGMISVMRMHCIDTKTLCSEDWKETCLMMREQRLKELTLEQEIKDIERSDIPPVEASQSETIDVDSNTDSADNDNKSDDDSEMVSNNTKLKKNLIFDDNDDNDEPKQQNAGKKETSADMIAGTSMNETQAIDREESEHTTGKAIMDIDVNRTDAQNDTGKSEKERTNKDHEKEYTQKGNCNQNQMNWDKKFGQLVEKSLNETITDS